jgi:carbamoyltransferase
MIFGITSLGHDASLAVIDGDQILFAAHAERYSRMKNDGNINLGLVADAINSTGGALPERIVWYERPLVKAARFARAGQWEEIRNTPTLRNHLRSVGLGSIPVSTVGHHESHAAAGFFTSPFDDAVIIVCDAIGEFDTISIWEGSGDTITKVWSQTYPHSLGLFYSAFTQRIGFKPNEEEFIMMGMAALGKPKYTQMIQHDFLKSNTGPFFVTRDNLHRGCRSWRPEITDVENIAASVQKITEDYLCGLAMWAQSYTGKANLVMMGGVALNCVANSKIAELGIYDDIWIMPNPGDAGSCIGAVAAHTKRRLDWRSAYLGYDIHRDFDTEGALKALLDGEVIGIANGRAEFGPRALGNRSLITDPRGPTTKDRVNSIKKREPFRPFAPIIMEHLADEYFMMPIKRSPYMQFVADVRRPDLFPAITHYDGTARVQTLRREENPVFYGLLERWYSKTGCPMLLNSSLNVKGQPLVNTWEDAVEFMKVYGVKVF